MKIVIFCHSLLSDWNHGNAHFLRGVATELMALGHRVEVYEQENAWSVEHLLAEAGESGLQAFRRQYPHLSPVRYRPGEIDLESVFEGTDLVLVHEWNEPALINRIGELGRQAPATVLLFHDTHHRAVSQPEVIAALDLRDYDGALVFGRSLAEHYNRLGLVNRTWVWHEAADIRVFRPMPQIARSSDVVWIGNWGDEERTAELRAFLLRPASELRLSGRVYGVRYPAAALEELNAAGIVYCGWVPNFKVPAILASAGVSVHIPRLPYLRLLPGIPTIRVFESLACGIPLVCASWRDSENLFDPASFLVANSGREMREHIRMVLNDPSMSRRMVRRGRQSILARHTCAHRATELLDIYYSLISNRTPASRKTA